MNTDEGAHDPHPVLDTQVAALAVMLIHKNLEHLSEEMLRRGLGHGGVKCVALTVFEDLNCDASTGNLNPLSHLLTAKILHEFLHTVTIR